MVQFDLRADTGWFEVSDEEGHTAALRPIATVVSGGKVYSLMGAIRQGDTGESEGGLVLVRQNTLLHREGTRYEVVGDEQETEQVMSCMMEALLKEAETADSAEMPLLQTISPLAGSLREFSICDQEDMIQ